MTNRGSTSESTLTYAWFKIHWDEALKSCDKHQLLWFINAIVARRVHKEMHRPAFLEHAHQKAGELFQCEASIEHSGAADGKYV